MRTPVEAGSSELPTIDGLPASGKRKLSQAEKALIAERTAKVLATANPGSPEYADACAQRAELGLVVPVVKNTAIDMLAMQQFRDVVGPDARRVLARPRYGVWLAVGLGLLAVGMAAYVFIDPLPAPPPRAASTAPSSTAPAATSPAPTVAPAPSPTLASTPATASAQVTVGSAVPPATAPASAPPPTVHVGASAPPPTSHPTAAPSSTTNPWAPVWKK